MPNLHTPYILIDFQGEAFMKSSLILNQSFSKVSDTTSIEVSGDIQDVGEEKSR